MKTGGEIMSSGFPLAGQRVNERRFCRSCGSGLEQATVSVAEVIRYLERDSYMSARRAAEYLDMSERSLSRFLHQIPHYRPGGKKLFKRSDLDLWMEHYRREPLDLKGL